MSAPNTAALGLSHVGKAVVFEEAGYSLLGPVAMHIFAPDEGNMHLLEAVASKEQKERWLRPLASGATRSCFCMTEPAPGAGSDPAAMNTTAVKDGNHYVINGTKWFITGADGAAFAIIMAKDEDGHATMFLADMDTPGIEIVRPDGQPGPGLRRRSRRGAASTICVCPPAIFWASRAKGSATPRSASPPRA